MNVDRRMFLASMAATLAGAAERLPANKNVKWAVSAALWRQFPRGPFTDILDIMRDTGFIGMRLTGFPEVLKIYDITPDQMEKEVSRRNLHVVTISFTAPTHDPAQHAKVIADAKAAMNFLKIFGAKHLVVFPPGRRPAGVDVDAAFRSMCACFNKIGKTAGEMGFRAGLHNHMGEMVQTPDEVDRAMALTDPKLFHFSPDTAHLHLGGSDVAATFEKYKQRLMFMDYKDARRVPLETETRTSCDFCDSIHDLGDGEIDFPACHRILKQIRYQGWICVDLDVARKGPRVSYERSGRYVVDKLEPIYL